MTINDQRFKPKGVFSFGVANVWVCDNCHTHGDANFAPQETIKGAVEKIRAAHTLASPECIGGTTYIRLVSLDRVQAKGRIA